MAKLLFVGVFFGGRGFFFRVKGAADLFIYSICCSPNFQNCHWILDDLMLGDKFKVGVMFHKNINDNEGKFSIGTRCVVTKSIFYRPTVILWLTQTNNEQWKKGRNSCINYTWNLLLFPSPVRKTFFWSLDAYHFQLTAKNKKGNI